MQGEGQPTASSAGEDTSTIQSSGAVLVKGEVAVLCSLSPISLTAELMRRRAQELCESRGGRPMLPGRP